MTSLHQSVSFGCISICLEAWPKLRSSRALSKCLKQETGASRGLKTKYLRPSNVQGLQTRTPSPLRFTTLYRFMTGGPWWELKTHSESRELLSSHLLLCQAALAGATEAGTRNPEHVWPEAGSVGESRSPSHSFRKCKSQNES